MHESLYRGTTYFLPTLATCNDNNMIIDFVLVLYTPKGCLKVLPLVTGQFNSFLKPYQLPGYTACATNITKLNQTPFVPSQVPIYPWEERSNFSLEN